MELMNVAIFLPRKNSPVKSATGRENGIQNIVCVQPFACLPNHVVGKGVIKTIRDMYPEANIVPVDYDPGASEANQTNRIKLLMTVAKDNLKVKQKEKKALQKENETREKEIVKK